MLCLTLLKPKQKHTHSNWLKHLIICWPKKLFFGGQLPQNLCLHPCHYVLILHHLHHKNQVIMHLHHLNLFLKPLEYNYNLTWWLLHIFYLYMTRINTIRKFVLISDNWFKNYRCKIFRVICNQLEPPPTPKLRGINPNGT